MPITKQEIVMFCEGADSAYDVVRNMAEQIKQQVKNDSVLENNAKTLIETCMHAILEGVYVCKQKNNVKRLEALQSINDDAPLIVCAACKLEDGTVLCGPRHWDMVMRAQAKAIGVKYPAHEVQGFVDARGRFLTRTEAWKVSEQNGQIRNRCGGDATDGGTLYSENLY